MNGDSVKNKFYLLETRADVAALLGISEKSLRYFLYKKRPENMYHTFEISKKDGTSRIISAPNKELKTIQRKLAAVLMDVYNPKACAYGFIREKSIMDNASRHVRKRLVLNIDLKDFFSQIHFGRVRGMLINPPYCIKKEAATTIAQIVCKSGQLPQGAPTSPIITNMICVPLDNALMRLAKNTGCLYTRYADDITFSTYKKEFDKSIASVENGTICIGDKLTDTLNKNSFVVNPEKITLRSRAFRQEVTGLTVNEFPNIRRNYTRELRAILHSCEKYGIFCAAKHYIEKGFCKNSAILHAMSEQNAESIIEDWFKHVLIGKVQYIRQVKGTHNLTYLTYAQKLNEIFEQDIFDVSELHRFENTIKRSTFILQFEDDSEFIQGSAFYLASIGIVTSYHVTQNGKLFKVYCNETYGSNELGVVGKTFNEISSDYTIDYAIYNPSFSLDPELGFRCGDSKTINIGDRVTIIGYPNHQKGNSPFIQTCNVTSKKMFQGAPFFTVSGRIVHGASGGIVQNSNHEAIGIIKGGIVSIEDDDINENQGFIPIHLAIEHMMNTASN